MTAVIGALIAALVAGVGVFLAWRRGRRSGETAATNAAIATDVRVDQAVTEQLARVDAAADQVHAERLEEIDHAAKERAAARADHAENDEDATAILRRHGR